MKNFLIWVIRNNVLVNLVVFIVLAMGVIASVKLVREIFPEISVDTLIVTMVYPGADPEDVEEGISRKIEEAIDGIEGIKKYTTVSSESVARTMIEVVEGFPMKDVYEDVRSAIDSVSNFPPDAEKPIIMEATIRNEVMLVTLWGDQPEQVLKEFAEEVKDEIQTRKSVSQAEVFGTRDYEIGIEVSEEKLREYGLTFGQVSEAVRRGSMNLSGGELRTRGEEIRIRTVGRKYTGGQFGEIVVLARPDGEIITLDRIAKIKDSFVEDEVFSLFNGKPAVTIGVYKTPSEDSIKIARDVREFMAAKQSELPEGLYITGWSDRTVEIESRIQMLVANGLQGLVIVFILLWLFLDLRLSFWVAMGIPFSFGAALFLMWLMGESLNMLSLFALIMVLGILVDDAVIIGEAIYLHRVKGASALMAPVRGVMEVGVPVMAGVTTTAIAFVPLFFVHGVIGKFIGIVPVAVITALVVSLPEALLILPAHLNHLPADLDRKPRWYNFPARIRNFVQDSLEWFLHHIYEPTIARALHYRYISLSLSVMLMCGTFGMFAGGFVKFVLFPDSDQTDIIAALEFPRGTPPQVTAAGVEQTELAFVDLKRRIEEANGGLVVKNYNAVVGENGGDFFDRSDGNHVGYIRAELVDAGERNISAQELLRQWEDATGPIPGALLQNFVTREQGPPGSAIQISLSSQDIETLKAVSERVKEKLRTYEGVYQISDSYRPGKNEIRVNLKPEARTMGIQLDDLARQVYAGYFGEEAVRLQRGRDDIRVRVRYTDDERATLAQLEKFRIRTPQGNEVPFFSVAEVEFTQGLASINRVDGARNITVIAEVDQQRQNTEEVLAEIGAATMPELEAQYQNFRWEYQGAKQQSAEAFTGLMVSFPLAILGMYIVVAATFGSYVQPLVILLSVPFGAIGAIWGHYAMGLDVSMFSVFGIVALAGVVVNDGIVLIDAYNQFLSEGKPVYEALAKAGSRRFRPILLTAMTTSLGLLPMIFESSSGADIMIGMSLSLAAGGLFATAITLFYVPCMVGILNDCRRIAFFLIHRRWPTREEVEPATHRHDFDEAGALQPSISTELFPAK